jgi:hypothetical protein
MLLACETLDDDEIENIRVALAENDVVTGRRCCASLLRFCGLSICTRSNRLANSCINLGGSIR